MTIRDRDGKAPPSDAALISDALRGCAQAYEALVRRYERSARATCFALTRDWHTAQDAAQEAFINAYMNLRSLKKPAAFGSWLLTIARRQALRQAQLQRDHELLDPRTEPASKASSATDIEELLEWISSLPAHERTVIVLRYIQGHDVAAISHICNRPLGTVTKQLSRAHKRLKRLLEKGERK